MTLEEQQAQAAKWADNFYMAASVAAAWAQARNIMLASHCYAFANSHPNALPWDAIKALAPIESQPINS